ncbi:MAG: zinc-binding alcohol dehydrogenase family protein [Terriglobus sp.]
MKAVGYRTPLSIEDPDALLDIELDMPVPRDRDLLVEVKAISVNPVDTKRRKSTKPDPGKEYKVLGWDCAGVVVGTGKLTSLFKKGDEVYYSGCIARQGANAQFHTVDERIVAVKPKNLSFAEAAALPLTSLTAWEILFDRFGVEQRRIGYGAPRQGSILIIGAAGGVGSMLMQIASHMTPLTVVATASRPETTDWCRKMGADYVIDHHRDIRTQMQELGLGEVEYIAMLSGTDTHYPGIAELLAPQGKIAMIDDPQKPVDARPLKQKSGTICWEFMFTRSYFETPDILRQHDSLTEVSKLMDLGTLKTTMTQNYGVINAQNLKMAHAWIESGRSVGKIVLEGWE